MVYLIFYKRDARSGSWSGIINVRTKHKKLGAWPYGPSVNDRHTIRKDSLRQWFAQLLNIPEGNILVL